MDRGRAVETHPWCVADWPTYSVVSMRPASGSSPDSSRVPLARSDDRSSITCSIDGRWIDDGTPIRGSRSEVEVLGQGRWRRDDAAFLEVLETRRRRPTGLVGSLEGTIPGGLGFAQSFPSRVG